MVVTLLTGDCLKVMKTMEDDSVDSAVIDPPYGIRFMSKRWDYDVPSVEVWREVYRVLKPGGHLLSFAGARTYHRVAVNIEDAGFEIRDQIMWLYSSGFPKSHNISKAINKVASADEAQQWEGWGTALKPAHEPIVVARKPFDNTVAGNIIEHGTSGLNIDGCRIIGDDEVKTSVGAGFGGTSLFEGGKKERKESKLRNGRWPANVIDSGNTYPFFYCPKANKKEREAGLDELELKLFGQSGGALGALNRNEETYIQEDTFGLNSIKERRNNHPTVKPIDLMRYLCRLITPPGGVVLDCFMGSGTTGIAACLEDFDFIGIEMDEDYMEIARHRIAYWGEYEVGEAASQKKDRQDWL